MAKEVKKETKKEVKKPTKKVQEKENFNQEKALAVTFVLLAILVIILLVVALVQKNKTEAKEESHITIPVLEEDTESRITINLKEFEASESNEYIFVVSNYREKRLIKENIEYDLKITNNDNIDIKLYKNDGKRDLLDEELEVEDNKLVKNKKQEDIYKLVIEKNNKIKEDSIIEIEIDS